MKLASLAYRIYLSTGIFRIRAGSAGIMSIWRGRCLTSIRVTNNVVSVVLFRTQPALKRPAVNDGFGLPYDSDTGTSDVKPTGPPSIRLIITRHPLYL